MSQPFIFQQAGGAVAGGRTPDLWAPSCCMIAGAIDRQLQCVMAHTELTAILETSQAFSPTIRPTSVVRNSSERAAPIIWGCRVRGRAK